MSDKDNRMPPLWERIQEFEVNLWLKIEALINKVLIFMAEAFTSLFLKVIPKSIPEGKRRLEKKCADAWAAFKVWIVAFAIQTFHQTKAKIIELKSMKFMKMKEELVKKSIQYKTKLEGAKAPKESIKQFFNVILSPIVNLLNKLTTMEPSHAIGAICVSALLFLGIMQIIVSGSRIYDKTRSPAAAMEEIVIPPRPSYYKLDQKQISLNQVKFPVYSQGRNSIQFLSVDFELDLSNRHIVLYLQDHEANLRDHLINNTEPIDPIFSLEKEGKSIIKEKVQKEINSFLKENNVRGEVSAVNIIYLLGA